MSDHRTIHLLREATAEIGRLRSDLSRCQEQLRIVAIFERALMGPPSGLYAAPDVSWELHKLADEMAAKLKEREAAEKEALRRAML